MDCIEILWRCPGWYKEQVIKICIGGDLDHDVDYRIGKSSYYLKHYKWIAIKLCEEFLGGKQNKLLNFGDDPDHHTDCPIRNLPITQHIMNRC